MHLRLTGLIAAVHTPLLDNGNVNLMVVERQAKYLLSGGVSGVFVCGTTGECHSLTVAERQQLAARWISVAGKQMPMIRPPDVPSLPRSWYTPVGQIVCRFFVIPTLCPRQLSVFNPPHRRPEMGMA